MFQLCSPPLHFSGQSWQTMSAGPSTITTTSDSITVLAPLFVCLSSRKEPLFLGILNDYFIHTLYSPSLLSSYSGSKDNLSAHPP